MRMVKVRILPPQPIFSFYPLCNLIERYVELGVDGMSMKKRFRFATLRNCNAPE
jgi:hypothetical protein